MGTPAIVSVHNPITGDVITSLHVKVMPFAKPNNKLDAFEYASMDEFMAKHWKGWQRDVYSKIYQPIEWRVENATVAQRQVHSYLFKDGKWFYYARTTGEFKELKVTGSAAKFKYWFRESFTEKMFIKNGYSTYFRQWLLKHSPKSYCPMLANVATSKPSKYRRA